MNTQELEKIIEYEQKVMDYLQEQFEIETIAERALSELDNQPYPEDDFDKEKTYLEEEK